MKLYHFCSLHCGLTILVILLLITINIVLVLLPCYKQGFNIKDDSILYPYRDSTVSSLHLSLLLSLTPKIVFFIAEYIASKPYNIRTLKVFGKIKIKQYTVEGYKLSSKYLFGMLIVLNIVYVGKVTTGELRPHFIAVCDPVYNVKNRTSNYIDTNEYVCRNTDVWSVKEARLSFPSGHSASSLYAATFFVLYLSERLQSDNYKFIVTGVQAMFTSYSIFIALSRISDYHHHTIDVLSGIILGVVCAVYLFRRLVKLKDYSIQDEEMERRTSL